MAQNVFSFLQYKKQLLVTPGNSWSHLATPGNICISSGHPWQLAGHIWQLAGGHIWQHILGYISCLESRQLTKIGQKNHNSFSTLATPGHSWSHLATTGHKLEFSHSHMATTWSHLATSWSCQTTFSFV